MNNVSICNLFIMTLFSCFAIFQIYPDNEILNLREAYYAICETSTTYQKVYTRLKKCRKLQWFWTFISDTKKRYKYSLCRGRSRISNWGAKLKCSMPTHYLAKFSWKLHENEENFTEMTEGHSSKMLLCRPATALDHGNYIDYLYGTEESSMKYSHTDT